MSKQTASKLQPYQFFYLLSDETRLRCLSLLQLKGELCVCDFVMALKMIQPKISRHLSILKKLGVVVDRRSGTWIYYRIHPNLPVWASQVLSNTVIGISETEPYASDRMHLDRENSTINPTCCI